MKIKRYLLNAGEKVQAAKKSKEKEEQVVH